MGIRDNTSKWQVITAVIALIVCVVIFSLYIYKNSENENKPLESVDEGENGANSNISFDYDGEQSKNAYIRLVTAIRYLSFFYHFS